MGNSNEIFMGYGMFLFWLVAILAIIGVVVFFRKTPTNVPKKNKLDREDTYRVLDKKLKDGEISFEDFNKVKSLIDKNNQYDREY